MRCRRTEQRERHRLGFFSHMANPTIILLDLLLVLLTHSYSTLSLDRRAKEKTAQQCSNKAKPYQIPFHVTFILIGCKNTNN